MKPLCLDLAGNKALESNWTDATDGRHDTTFVYDAANRLTDRSEPLGRLTHYEYDAAGKTHPRDPFGHRDDSFSRVVEHD